MSSEGPLTPRKILTPTELTRLIRLHLEQAFSDLWVEGEIGSLRILGSGHVYFTLKDATSQIKGVIFRSSRRFLRFIPKEGQSVLIRGHLSLYEARGEYELVVDYVEPKGVGALQAAFEALKERLSREGLFDPSRKRDLPFLPQKIGIVTSPVSAALRDVLKVFRRRFYGLSILIAPVPVQGAGAAEEIANAIEELGNRGELDLIIVTRGGGSLEDLYSFNEEVVARAIADCPIPVVSAIGHETDFTIADFVADFRASTPSSAAELVVPNQQDMLEKIAQLYRQLAGLLQQKIAAHRQHVEAESRLLQTPQRQLDHHFERVDGLCERLSHQIDRILYEYQRKVSQTAHHLSYVSPEARLERLGERLLSYGKFLEKGLPELETKRVRFQVAGSSLWALSPLRVLSRGYSIVQKAPRGEIVRAAETLNPNDLVRVRFHEGEADFRVENVSPSSTLKDKSLEIP